MAQEHVIRTYGTVACLLALCLGASAQSSAKLQLIGVGGTFPLPVYSKWFLECERNHPAWELRYLPAGSGEGIKQVSSGAADFAGSDVPMTDREIAQAKVQVMHFPTLLGAAVAIYNLPELQGPPLRFTPQALSGIYLGTVKKWNHVAIATVNPGVRLPSANILVIHRNGASGTSYIWTDYLAKISTQWKTQVGKGAEVNWPVGEGVTGNGGLADKVAQTPYAIGYVELAYAIRNHTPYALVRNSAGNFIKADLNSVTAAAASTADSLPGDFRASITNAPGPHAYPISSFTWLLVPAKVADSKKKAATKEVLRWMLTDGQHPSVESEFYAPLPDALVRRELRAIAKIR